MTIPPPTGHRGNSPAFWHYFTPLLPPRIEMPRIDDLIAAHGVRENANGGIFIPGAPYGFEKKLKVALAASHPRASGQHRCIFNHGVHEAEGTAATAVATTTTRVAATRMVTRTATRTAATQRRQRIDGNATAATQRRRRAGSDATAAGIDTDSNQLVPHGSDHRLHNLAQSTFSGN